MPRGDADTIRVLVATDSHVGYEERDPIRKDDSWKSFDEVMQLAKAQDVDMILLAGDLFHDNKPSRKSMYQVMRSLRQNCLGDKPCELEWLSDASDIFDGAFNHVNYEDPDINVAIPAFSIHGNHDDPSGDGHYCSLDLLQVSGLLNYFGRTPESDKIDIKPVLLQKGHTKLALYGMSNVRDERLYRTFKDGNVKFFRPTEQKKDWFNIMAVHQNHHAYSASGYLPEHFLPDFMDLIVWGHEHECLIEPRMNPEMQFHVMQPGSSVATSLVPGEAVPKHVAILSITGKEFKVEKHRIKSVRPFVTKELVLASDARFRGLAKVKDNKIKLTQGLVAVVEELIEAAKAEWLAIQDEEIEPEEIPLPLVRLKVEYSPPESGGKFECENPQRFSNRFLGKVANVNDVVQFHRKKIISKKDTVEKVMPDQEILASMESDSVKVSKLVHEYLNAQSLKIMPKPEFGDAVTQYVDNDDKHAMETLVSDNLHTQIKKILNLDLDEDNLDEHMERFRAEREAAFASGQIKKPNRNNARFKPRPDDYDTDMEGIAWEDNPDAITYSDGEAKPAKPAARRGVASVFLSDDEASVISTGSKKTAAKRVPAKRAPAKPKTPAKAKAAAKAPARGRKKAPEPSDDDGDDVIMLDDDGEEPPAPKPQPRPAAATSSRGRQTQLNFSQPKTQTAVELSDDEISDDDAFEPVAAPKPSSRRR